MPERSLRILDGRKEASVNRLPRERASGPGRCLRAVIGLWVVVLLLAGCAARAPEYWPTEGWRTSTPEAQGMDSERLARLLEYVEEHEIELRSVVIVRNGYIVLEAYYYPFDASLENRVCSVTKSVTSALVGIAIGQGHIRGVDERVLDLFSEREVANIGPWKEAMTLAHLLTMSSGIEWSHPASVEQMQATEDWAQFVLDRPMSSAPGTVWNYHEGGSHLLSVLVQEKSGMRTADFADQYLFGPLGIGPVRWGTDPDGVVYGGHWLHLRSRDMAKFGYLYLKDGVWDGRQVVPAGWVRASAEGRLKTDSYPYYGYQWWVSDDDDYTYAYGYGEQKIYVVPEKEMVVVITASIDPDELAWEVCPEYLLEKLIIPAIRSRRPLRRNEEGEALLRQWVEAASQPQPEPVPSLPALAEQTAGRTYVLRENYAGWRAFSLAFQAQEAALTIAFGDSSEDLAIGLDGVHRVGHYGQVGELFKGEGYWSGPTWTEIGARGRWEDENTFVVTLMPLEGVLDYVLGFDFAGDDVTATLRFKLYGEWRTLFTIPGTLQK
jgi:CubicO group peptidase (beta-lactamase class C family)